MIQEKAPCKTCGGKGVLTFSFEPPRPCYMCNGSGAPPIKTETHTRIIHFENGDKRTIQDVVAVWENQFVHILMKNGTEWIINPDKVLAVEVIR